MFPRKELGDLEDEPLRFEGSSAFDRMVELVKHLIQESIHTPQNVASKREKRRQSMFGSVGGRGPVITTQASGSKFCCRCYSREGRGGLNSDPDVGDERFVAAALFAGLC